MASSSTMSGVRKAAVLLLTLGADTAALIMKHLTDREIECLRWCSKGNTGWEIGRILGITEATVKKHVRSIETKLGCVNKSQAIAHALRWGLIP